MAFYFPSEQINRLFPFHLHLSKELELLSCGRSLQKLIGSVVGRHFTEQFACYRPQMAVYNYISVAALAGQLVVLRCNAGPSFMLRGQFEVLEDGSLIFIGTPWFSRMHEVTAAGLTLDDFAPHDPMVDLLHLVHTQEIATHDIQALYEKMAAQSKRLQVLVKEKDQLASLPMQNPDPVLRIDLQGTILMQNPAAMKLPAVISYKNQQLSYAGFFQQIAREIEITNGPVLIEASAGDKTLSFNCYRLPEENYINIYSRDVSAKKELEAHLQGTANRLSTLITNLQAGVLLENENRTIALVNQRFCDLFEIPVAPDQLMGADCSRAAEQTMHMFKDPAAFTQRIDQLLEQKKLAKADVLELQNGRVYARDFIPIFSGKTYMGHLWVYNDITAETTVNEALHRQRAFYEDILNNLPADIAVFNKKQEYLFLNPRAVKDPQLRAWMIGKTDEDYRKLKNKEPEVFSKRKQLFHQLLAQKKPALFEEALPLPNGGFEHHLRIFFPVLNAQQEIEMIIGYGIDITERKKMEERLEQALHKTEEEASMKERFFATMSHEIRTPLNGILGVTDLLSKTPLLAEQHAFTEMIRSSGNQLLRIVNDVLDFQKITNGSIEPDEIGFELSEHIQQAAAPFAVLAAEKQLTFSVHLPATPLFVSGDVHRIRQILNNLLSNAIKFTETGKIEVALQHTVMANQQCQFSITVSDTGTGIEPQSLRSIFEPYTQAGSAISRKYGGTGLGLTISRHLAQLMGGDLFVTSEPGKGSVFTLQLQLPVTAAADQPEQPVFEALSAEARKNLRILVAEDSKINQFLLQHILNQWGCTFALVETGEQVLVQLEQADYDIILMDIEMPVMDGMEATQRIRRSDKKWSHIPIIAITANAMKGSREQYLAAGMNGYVTKPFKDQELQEAIASILETGTQVNNQHASDNSITPNVHLAYFESMSNDPQFIEQMKDLLRQNIPAMLNRLQEAQAAADPQALAAVLHQLKPLARMLALEETEALIIASETRTRNKKESKLSDAVFQKINQNFLQIIQYIG